MKYIIEHAEEIEKLLKVKAQVSEVKSIMLENIDKVSLHRDSLPSLLLHYRKTENSELDCMLMLSFYTNESMGHCFRYRY